MRVNIDELRKQKQPKSCVECPYGDHEAWCLIDGDWRERYYMPEDKISENCPIWKEKNHKKGVDKKQNLC